SALADWGATAENLVAAEVQMIGSRVLGAACAAILVSCLGSLVACGGADDKSETSAKTVQDASVTLVAHGPNGERAATGSGILIGERTVLTAAHLVAGNSRWTITSADGKTTATGLRGLTYDWMVYDSQKAHPRKHDVAVIYLDRPIRLSSYPQIASDKLANGTDGTRIRANGASFSQMGAVLKKYPSF